MYFRGGNFRFVFCWVCRHWDLLFFVNNMFVTFYNSVAKRCIHLTFFFVSPIVNIEQYYVSWYLFSKTPPKKIVYVTGTATITNGEKIIRVLHTPEITGFLISFLFSSHWKWIYRVREVRRWLWCSFMYNYLLCVCVHYGKLNRINVEWMR